MPIVGMPNLMVWVVLNGCLTILTKTEMSARCGRPIGIDIVMLSAFGLLVLVDWTWQLVHEENKWKFTDLMDYFVFNYIYFNSFSLGSVCEHTSESLLCPLRFLNIITQQNACFNIISYIVIHQIWSCPYKLGKARAMKFMRKVGKDYERLELSLVCGKNCWNKSDCGRYLD